MIMEAMRRWIAGLTLRSVGMLVLSLLTIGRVVAQGFDCPTYVDQALDAVSAACETLGRNQVCYGNNAVDAEFDAANVPASFVHPGDRANVRGLERLTTAPLAPDHSTWGVAVMALQANLPDATPGQNVTFILFGDADVTPDESTSADYASPMQAFRLSTRITGVSCQDVPESGMLVQAPDATTVTFSINGVDVKVGSSAMLQTDGEDLTVDTIEGFVEVTSQGATEVAGEGTSVRVPRGRRPLRAAITRAERLLRAPWRLLPRRVEVLPPPPAGQIVELNDCFAPSAQRAIRNPVRVSAGQPVVLRVRILHQSLELARIIQRQTRTTLSIEGQPSPPYTRIGPWRGDVPGQDDDFGMEFYWLVADPPSGFLSVELTSQTLSGRAIQTGIDGPDPDNQPEIIPARRRLFCAVQVGA